MNSKLFRKDFLLLWQGQLFSAIGTQLFNIALMYWLLETTGSATTMGFVMTMSLIPVAVMSLFTGALVDRMPRKTLIVGADLVRGFLCIGFVFAIDLADADYVIIVLFVYVLVGGIASSLFSPALRASLPEIVGRPDLHRANSLLLGASSFASTVGAAAGGFLYGFLGAPILFLANGVSFLLSALSECFVTIPSPESHVRQPILNDIREGLFFIFHDRGLRRIVGTVACMNITSAPLTITLPMLVRDHYSAGPEFLGLLAASSSIGSLTAASLIGITSITERRGGSFAWISLLVCAGSLVTMVYVEYRPLVFVAFTTYGIGMVFFNVPIQVAIQSNTPSALRGRVISASTSLVAGVMPIAAAITGILIDAIDKNVPIVWISTAAIFVGCSLSLATSNHVRRYLSKEYDVS